MYNPGPFRRSGFNESVLKHPELKAVLSDDVDRGEFCVNCFLLHVLSVGSCWLFARYLLRSESKHVFSGHVLILD